LTPGKAPGARLGAVLLALLLAGPALAAATDPLANGARWEDMRREFLPADAAVVFDARVKVIAPISAENALNVPVTVDATALAQVEDVIVFADNNPIVRILRFQPDGALPVLGFRVKLQQSTPVRAAARTADGVWHVAGAWVNTTGGGCTLPSTGSASPAWQKQLNAVSSRVWPRQDGGERIRLRVVHPEDTGLAAGIPAFYIEALQLADSDGRSLLRIQGFEPIAENPVFTVDLPAPRRGGYRVSGHDNNGNAIAATVEK